MKLLYVIPSLERGGAERQLVYLASAMQERGCEVHVAFGRAGDLAAPLARTGITLHHVGGAGTHDLRMPLRLLRLMAALRPAVVQTTLTQMDIVGGIAALGARVPWVLRESSASACYDATWKSRIRRWLGQHANAIVSNSNEGDAYWRGSTSARSVVPNGIPSQDVVTARAGASESLMSTHLPLVLFAGRLDAGKNAGALVEALGAISASIPYVALFCGDGAMRPSLESRVATLGLASRVRFAGYVDDLWWLMTRASIMVTTSRYEGCPNAVLEAMAAGCPLIVSDIPAHRAILDEQSAIFVNADDSAAVAQAIETALTTDALRTRAEAAAVRARQWTIEAMADGYEAVYRSLAHPAR